MFNKKPPKDLASRQAILWLHPQTIASLMTSMRWVVVDNQLPADVKVLNSFWDPTRQVFGLVLQSKEFKPVLLGSMLPELPPLKMRYFDVNKDKPLAVDKDTTK